MGRQTEDWVVNLRRPGESRGPGFFLRLKAWIPAFAGMTIVAHLSAADPLKTLSHKLHVALSARGLTPMSVVSFTYYKEQMSTGSHLVSERLTTYLVQEGAPVVERRLIPKLMEEWRLWQTGVVKPNVLKDIGQVLGVDVLVSGTLADRNDDTTDVIARAIHVGSGEVLAAAYALIPRVWYDKPKSFPRYSSQVAIPMGHAPKGLVRVKNQMTKRSFVPASYRSVPVPFVTSPGLERRKKIQGIIWEKETILGK